MFFLPAKVLFQINARVNKLKLGTSHIVRHTKAMKMIH